MATLSYMFGLWLTPTLGLILIIGRGVAQSNHDHIGFLPEPQDVIAVRNQSLRINCTTTGLLDPKITWHKDGVALSNPRRYSVSNGSLIIKKVIHKPRRNRTDQGFYTCYAKDKFGTISSRPIKLTIAGIPRILEGPKDVKARVGETVRFSCQTAALSPVILWEKNRRKLPHDERVSVFEELGAFQISNIRPTDQGKYRCKVVNVVGTRSSNEAQLTVTQDETQKAAYFLATPQSLSRCVGEAAILECAVGGWPAQDVEWLRQDGRTIAGIRYSIVGGANLKIDNVQLSDNGTYICRIRSNHAQRGAATLTVQSPPYVTSTPSSLSKMAFSTIRLTCVASGVPRPTITWYKNGGPVHRGSVTYFEEKNESVLVVVSAQVRDSGYYQCRAENYAGFHQVVTRLEIWISKYSPDPPTDVRAVTNGSAGILLKWRAVPEKDGIKIVGYTIHYWPTHANNTIPYEEVVMGQITQYRVTGLHPFTNYTFYLNTFNSKSGSYKTSIHVTAVTAEGVPTAAPQVMLQVTSATSIKVIWKKLPPNQANGIVVKYHIVYKEDGRPSERIKEVNSAIRDCTLTDLKPSTLYQVRVLAGTGAGYPKLQDDYWPWVRAKTLHADMVDGSPRLQLKVINDSALLVNWQPSSYDVLPVTAFELKYRRNDKQEESADVHRLTLASSLRARVITSLQPSSWYEVSLVARNENGEGHAAMETIQMEAGAEAGVSGFLPPPPRDIEAEPVNMASIRIAWRRPPQNANIAVYNIRYRPVQSSDRPTTTFRYVASVKEEIVVSNLKPFTNYAFSVQANTTSRAGRYSSEIRVRTREGVPSAPQNALVKLLTPKTAELSWSPPAKRNGVILYYVIYYTQEDDHQLPSMHWLTRTENGSVTVAEFTELEEDHIYNFKIQAATKAGLGAATNVMQIRTQHMPIAVAPSQMALPADNLAISVGVAASVVSLIFIIVAIIIVVCRRSSGSLQGRQTDYMVAERLANQDARLPNGNSHVTMVHLSCDQQVTTFIPKKASKDNTSNGYISLHRQPTDRISQLTDQTSPPADRTSQLTDELILHHKSRPKPDNEVVGPERVLSMPVTERDIQPASTGRDSGRDMQPALSGRDTERDTWMEEDSTHSPLLYSEATLTSSDNTPTSSSLHTSPPPTSQSSLQDSAESPHEATGRHEAIHSPHEASPPQQTSINDSVDDAGPTQHLCSPVAMDNQLESSLPCCHSNTDGHNRQSTSCVTVGQSSPPSSSMATSHDQGSLHTSLNTSVCRHSGNHSDHLSNPQTHDASHNARVTTEPSGLTCGCVLKRSDANTTSPHNQCCSTTKPHTDHCSTTKPHNDHCSTTSPQSDHCNTTSPNRDCCININSPQEPDPDRQPDTTQAQREPGA